jgi:hypothetical protein
MVLANGGVECIDAFDKMRDEERVATHEAMDHQTISRTILTSSARVRMKILGPCASVPAVSSFVPDISHTTTRYVMVLLIVQNSERFDFDNEIHA